jgi:hypothetical protein
MKNLVKIIEQIEKKPDTNNLEQMNFFIQEKELERIKNTRISGYVIF